MAESEAEIEWIWRGATFIIDYPIMASWKRPLENLGGESRVEKTPFPTPWPNKQILRESREQLQQEKVLILPCCSV